MNSNRRLGQLVFVCAGLLLANALQQYMADNDLGIGWPHNVLRNWEQLGWRALGGQLVVNPGGNDGLQQPEVYPGHRALSLYPPFLVGWLFSCPSAGKTPAAQGPARTGLALPSHS